MPLEEGMTDYCNNAMNAPPLKATWGMVLHRAKKNCSSDASLDLVVLIDVINMVLYVERHVNLTPVQYLLERVMEVMKNRQSPQLGANNDNRPVGNPYRPATVSPFASRPSGVYHPQDHHYMPNRNIQRDYPRISHYLLDDDKTAIDACLEAVLVRERNKNVEYLNDTNCWKNKVVPAVNKEYAIRYGKSLFAMLNQRNTNLHKGLLNEFLRNRFRLMQSNWGVQDLNAKPRAKKT
jgi:hypothetical protein